MVMVADFLAIGNEDMGGLDCCRRMGFVILMSLRYLHTGKCIRRFAGIYAYCRYFIDRKW